MREPIRHWSRWLALSALVVALDLATKGWMMRAFSLGESVEVTPFFNLVLIVNRGAAFSILATAGGWQRWFFAAVTVVIGAGILWMHRREPSALVATALALVLGGALGNLWDRLALGHVIDFVQLHAAGYYWPAFNVADSAISVGVALLVWDSLRSGGARRSRALGQEK